MVAGKLLFCSVVLCLSLSSFTYLTRVTVPSVGFKLSSLSSTRSTRDVITGETVSKLSKIGGVLSLLISLNNVAFASADEFEVNAVSDSFIETESGLKYRDVQVGTGESPIPGSTVRVNYTGWLDDFDSVKKFDSSYDRRKPLVFKVGVRQVIAGWDEALLSNMKVGTKRDVIIPAALGYGSRGAGGVIPPNAVLYFRMELVGIGNKSN